MKKNLKSIEGFETQTEQELHEIMGGSVATTALTNVPVAAYAIMIGSWLLKQLFK